MNMTEDITKECSNCGKRGMIAEDETDPGQDELALDARGVVSANEYVCGECLEAAEDGEGEEPSAYIEEDLHADTNAWDEYQQAKKHGTEPYWL